MQRSAKQRTLRVGELQCDCGRQGSLSSGSDGDMQETRFLCGYQVRVKKQVN